MIDLVSTGPTSWDVFETKTVRTLGDDGWKDQEARERIAMLSTKVGTSEEEALAMWAECQRPPTPTPHDVKQEAGRRILAQYPIWKQMNLMGEGGPSFTEMSAAILAIRAKSNDIEAMEPIPEDFRSDSYWM